MTKEEVIEALEKMLMYSDPVEVNCEALREAIRLIKDSSYSWWDD